MVMQEIILKQKNELEVENYVDKFLNYIDVSNKTVETYKIALRQFCSYLHEKGIKNPTREEIIEYREYLKEHLKPTSVNAYLIAIRNLYNYLEYEGITKNITKNIKGIKLEQRHLKRGLSQEELRFELNNASDFGVSRQSISDWENGRSEPKLENIKLLAKALNVSCDTLLDDEIELNNEGNIITEKK